LVVAGGANFPRPIWESQKIWRRKIHVLTRQGTQYKWTDGGTLPMPIAYGAAISTHRGIICLGGNRGDTTFDRVFALRWDQQNKQLTRLDCASLPKPCAYGQATLIGDVLYLAGGQHRATLDSAMANLWALDLSGTGPLTSRTWRILPPCPGGPRAFNLTVAQNNGADDCLYVISGRRQGQDGVQFLRDTWEYNVRLRKWRRRADAPRCVMAGTAIATPENNVVILGGADGALFDKADLLKDRHPGFPRRAWQFDTAANSWISAGTTPQNHVTTHAVRFGNHVVVASGEIRPRVRSPWVWRIEIPGDTTNEEPQ
jgi:N-acetylneuraminic acid mutarotase